MICPLYIYYELLIRISDIKSDIGDYISHTDDHEICIIRTSNGTVKVAMQLLKQQFDDPNEINNEDLTLIVKTFNPNYL